MVLRMAALIAVVAVAPVAAFDTDSLPPAAPAVFDTSGAFATDAAVLAAIDALLVDPVRLHAEDLERLRILPWLDAGDIAALGAALPLGGASELVSRAGWSADAAARTLPFLRFASRPRAAPPWALTLRGDRRRIDVRVAHARAHLAARVRDERGGSLAVRHAGLRAVGGDFRLGIAQGLLMWTSASALDVGAAPVRRTPGVVAAATRSGLRGGAFELQRARLDCNFGGGTSRAGVRGMAATCGLRRGDQRLGVAVARVAERDGAGVDWSSRRGARRVAAEAVWVAPAAHAVALAAESRHDAWRWGVRVQSTRGALLEWAGIERGAARTHAAAAQLRWTHRDGEAGVDVVHAAARHADGVRVERSAWDASCEWRAARTRAGFQVTSRARRTTSLAGGGEPVRTTQTLSVRGRVQHAAASGWVLQLEGRARGDPRHLDRAWQLACERDARHGGVALSLASFRAVRRWALAVPGGAGVAASVRGDGMRVAAAARGVWHGVSLQMMAACIWEDGLPLRTRADAGASMRWPRQGF